MNRTNRLASLAVMSTVSLAGVAHAGTATEVNYIRFHGVQIAVTNAKITSVSSGSIAGNIATVAPGAAITVEADYFMAFSNNAGDYSLCPGCFVQNYLAWYPDAVAEGASPANIGFWDGQSLGPGNQATSQGATSGHVVFNTIAPTTPGDYQIGIGETLDFGYVPGATGSAGFDLSQPIPPGPASFASFLINVSNNAPEPCPGDINGDGLVNSADFNILAGAFGFPCF